MINSIKDYEKHFLFNSLNLIKYFCRTNSEKASELVVVFASLLNYMIFDKREYVDIIEEIEQLYYVNAIQKLRFSNEIILKEEIKNVAIPKAILLHIFLLGYNINVLRSKDATVEIKVKKKVINIKMSSNLELDIEEIKQNEFFQKIYEKISNLNLKLNLNVDENKLNFDIFL